MEIGMTRPKTEDAEGTNWQDGAAKRLELELEEEC